MERCSNDNCSIIQNDGDTSRKDMLLFVSYQNCLHGNLWLEVNNKKNVFIWVIYLLLVNPHFTNAV